MDTKRLMLFVVFSFSIMMLWESWQREHAPLPAPVTAGKTDIPQAATQTAAPQAESHFSLGQANRIQVRTDVLDVELDSTGGDIRQVQLLQHRDSQDAGKSLLLMNDQASPALYIAQSGLIGNELPTHKAIYVAQGSDFTLGAGQDQVEVPLTWEDGKGVRVDKIYTFKRGSYVVDMRYDIHNGSSSALDPTVYYQIVHDSESAKSSRMMPTFTGAAYYTEADKYKKVSFDDMKKSNLSKNSTDGWIGLVQHYFVGAWIPKQQAPREYYTKQLTDTLYSMGAKEDLGSIAPGANLTVDAQLYVGPQEQSNLKAAAPGLEYTVDYGWLTVIATPLFWVLSQIQKLAHNWGVAIILLTVLLKLAFYPLSAASYRSMAHMRELAPRLQRLKEQYGDDRQKLHQAMMELYKTEKINPMGGCLPILIQVPVFIALYWVLLGSVELRHAPFMLWIHDLSATDPYYVLPVLMGITMIIQSRLNPKPPDPIQARVMQIMPVVFSVFFFFFPAGLVLYWLVNNVLSILQQWHINRTIGQHGKKGHARS